MAAPIAIGAVDALVSNTNGCKAVRVRHGSYRPITICSLNKMIIYAGSFGHF